MGEALTVGQTLWYAPNRGEPFEVEVTKVGRKWASIGKRHDCCIYDKGRVTIDTMIVDSTAIAPDRCYRDREGYEREQDRARGWRALTDYVRGCYHVPNGVSLDAIVEAMALIHPTPAGERRGREG